ncbi:MAG: S8 family serine peptidase [Bdellovibrionales bacterium]|nr:S8 family serine peptidase [Bdellovibrionales bacterium]
MMVLLFSLIVNLWAESIIIAKVSPENLALLNQELPHIKPQAFTYFKRFPKFKDIYVFHTPSKKINKYLGKVYSTDKIQAFNISPTPKDSLSPVGQKIPDSYYNYQWYLETQDHKLETQKYGLGKFIETKAIKKTASLEWFDVKAQFESSFQRKALVAVLDSGVDIRHPDISKHIYKNQAECRYVEATDLYLPEITFKEDVDNNGYAGDCAGWNFTSFKRPRRGEKLTGDNQVYDDTGHGKHIAGRMAAQQTNIGIVGLSQNIEILPVKVLKKVTSERESRMISYEGLSHWVAQGILYAVDKNVDVINLSLGWPERVQSELVNKAIETAHEAGVILVAGSGNDSHNASIYPCAHKHVICVGASNIEGKLSNFSNYGPHVDVLAPGESIISLIPQKVDTLDLENIYIFSDDLLAYMSGSSQSAPMISAIASMLKTQNKNFNEIKNLLISSSSSSQNTQAGLVSLKKLMCLLKSPDCSFNKKDILIHSKAKAGDGKLYLELENLSQNEKNFVLEIQDRNGQFLSKQQVKLLALENKTQALEFTFDNLSSEIELQIKYNNQILNIVADNKKTNFDKVLEFKDTPESILNQWQQAYDNKNPSYLFTIKSLENNQSTQLFFTREIDYENKNVKVNFFELTDLGVQFLGHYTIENVQNLLSVSMSDLDMNGTQDIFIRALARDNDLNRPYEKLIYLNQDLSLIQEFSLYADKAVASTASEIKFYNSNELRLPYIFKNGLVSKKSISKNNYQHLIEDLNVGTQRVYQFVPSKNNPNKLEEVSFTNSEWFDHLADQLYRLVFDTNARPIYYKAELLLVLHSDGHQVELITRLYNQKTEPHTQQHFFKTTIDLTTGQFQSVPLNIQPMQILGNKYVGMISLNEKEHNNFTLSSINNNKREQLRLLHFINGQWQTQQLRAESLEERFIAFHSAYFDNEYVYLHLENINDIVIQQYKLNDLENVISEFKKPKIKSTFLPPFSFDEFYLPIFIKNDQQNLPALYNDQSQLFSGRIQVLVPTDTQLLPSYELSYEVSEECHNMPLQFEGRKYQAVVFCPKEAVFKIKDLELKTTTSFFQ